VPYCVSTIEANRNASVAQIREAVPYTQAFIDVLPDLRAIIFYGRRGHRAMPFQRIPRGSEALATFHPAARSYSRTACRVHMEQTFAEAFELLIAS
jgi:hypothetical protein